MSVATTSPLWTKIWEFLSDLVEPKHPKGVLYPHCLDLDMNDQMTGTSFDKGFRFLKKIIKIKILWVGMEGCTKVQSLLQPRLAPLVPSICSPIFAKRSWRFWTQELENVYLFVQCLKSQTFSDSCAQNRHDLLAKIGEHIDGT